MPLIDENGRVFGKVNLIDAAVGGLVFGLVPLAFLVYLLFQTPNPRFDPIAPVTLTEGTEFPLVVVTGEHMRPLLRVIVGGIRATYMFETTERAVVRLPQLDPGTYDLVFFVEAREIARQTDAIIVSLPAPPSVEVTIVRLVGAFVGLTLEQARALETDEAAADEATAGWGAEVVRTWTLEPDVTRLDDETMPSSVLLGTYRVPAVLRVRCGFVNGTLQLLDDERRVLGSDERWELSEEVRRALAITIAPGKVLSIPGAVRELLSHGIVTGDALSFHVQRMQPDPPVEPPPPSAVTRVRLVGAFIGLSPEQAQALQEDPAAARAMTAGWGAEILSLDTSEPDIAVLEADNVPQSRLMGRQRVPAVLRVRCAVVNGTLRLLDDEGRVLGTDPALDLSDEVRRALAVTIAPGIALSIPAVLGHLDESDMASDAAVVFSVQSVQPDPVIEKSPPSAVMRVRLVGAFTGLTPERAEALWTDAATARAMTAGWGAEILGLGPPEPDIAMLNNNMLPGLLADRQRVPAVVSVWCAVVDGALRLQDRALAIAVEPGAVLSIPVAIREDGATDIVAADVVTFYVEQVFPAGTEMVEVTARVITRPPIVELLRTSLAEPDPLPAFAALRPRLLEFEIEREVLGTTLDELRQGLTSILVASFRLPAVRTSSGWAYGTQLLKPGVEFWLETPEYRVFCQVLTIEVP